MNKFHAKRTKCHLGYTHASGKEANRCNELHLLEKAGQIRDIRQQPEFPCHVVDREVPIGLYRGDFSYIENGKLVVEDVKSGPTKTPLYRWKKKHVEAQYGIKIREV